MTLRVIWPDESNQAAPRWSCSLCGGDSPETIGVTDRRGQPLQTVMCQRCGLVSHAQVPSDRELAEYYEQQYRQDYNGERTPSARRVVREWRRGELLFAALQPYVHPGQQVFEIGAGMGCNLKQFELAGLSAHGIEPGEDFQAFARDQLQADISPTMLADVSRAPVNHLALLVHVLEHLPKPVEALRQIRDTLLPGGLLYVEVPNFGAPHAAPGKWFHYAHIYNFNAATLKMVGRAAGYEVVRELSAGRKKNLSILFRRAEEKAPFPTVEIDPTGVALTRAAVGRFNTFTYHARPSYLAGRIGQLATRFSERRGAKQRLVEIIDLCRRTKRHTAGRKAA